MRWVLLGVLLLGNPVFAMEKLSGHQVEMVMRAIEPVFTTLTVCVNGKCSAAYECGHPPSLFKRPDGAVQVFIDCDVTVYFHCSNGVRLRRPTDWCRVDYPNGKYLKVTMTYDGFLIEGV